ncbi:exonuclease III APE [Besnoitia besnoiti]|uniref:DNA-(apurinic or apyrimidinic site) endonuclease n=1 Tax=Besnoitia besnoiti TaxID=94643 RepID=A0A2A9MGS6_BESBE|nr:exonuclease III APE [Besnoitia besnoiti]PFH34863.1 exonuclease III APE [Besnoitia besnoiti]
MRPLGFFFPSLVHVCSTPCRALALQEKPDVWVHVCSRRCNEFQSFLHPRSGASLGAPILLSRSLAAPVPRLSTSCLSERSFSSLSPRRSLPQLRPISCGGCTFAADYPESSSAPPPLAPRFSSKFSVDPAFAPRGYPHASRSTSSLPAPLPASAAPHATSCAAEPERPLKRRRRTKMSAEGTPAAPTASSLASPLSAASASAVPQPESVAGKQETTCDAGEQPAKRKLEKRSAPLSIVTWNVNSLAARMRDPRQWFFFSRFLQTTEPDILCFQEVKLAAHGPPGAKRGDGMPRDHSRIKSSDKVSSVEAKEISETLGALLPHHKLLISLADWRYSGQMMFIKKDIQVRSVRYNLCLGEWPAQQHDPEGRVILAEFDPFCVLATYSPNNGGTQKSFQRRRLWDERMREFVTRLKKPLIWVGDLNCAPEDIDLSDPERFRSVIHENDDGTIDPENIGQAGCTDAERRRFREILEAGDLVDAFRGLHPRTEPPPLESAEYSWRGFGGTGPRGMLRGLGMRLDHIVLTKPLMEAVELVRICGAGKSKSNFFGSDHCPVLVRLKEREVAELPAVYSETLCASATPPAAKKRREGALAGFFEKKRREQQKQPEKASEAIVVSDSSDSERRSEATKAV